MVLQPVIHLVCTSHLETLAQSQLQLCLRKFYIGRRHTHSQSFPSSGLHVVLLFAKTLKPAGSSGLLAAQGRGGEAWAELTGCFVSPKLCDSVPFVTGLAPHLRRRGAAPSEASSDVFDSVLHQSAHQYYRTY